MKEVVDKDLRNSHLYMYASCLDWRISPHANRSHRSIGGQFVTRASRLSGQLSHLALWLSSALLIFHLLALGG